MKNSILATILLYTTIQNLMMANANSIIVYAFTSFNIGTVLLFMVSSTFILQWMTWVIVITQGNYDLVEHFRRMNKRE